MRAIYMKVPCLMGDVRVFKVETRIQSVDKTIENHVFIHRDTVAFKQNHLERLLDLGADLGIGEQAYQVQNAFLVFVLLHHIWHQHDALAHVDRKFVGLWVSERTFARRKWQLDH